MPSGLGTWTATGAATLASTYALDAISTAAGVVLVASGLLGGIGIEAALALLLASYAVWAMALRPSLGANWELLSRTGACACLPSKIAHDIALRRRTGVRARRIATAAAYVGAELAKEAPYYLGAAGAALMAEGVTSADVVIFLAGANLGASAYEYGLAQAVRRLLARAPAKRFASFEEDWDPGRYLADYYREVEADERHTIAFLAEAAREMTGGEQVLIFGAGPTVHHAFAFAGQAGAIDLSDFLPANLAEIERWRADAPGAHDWRPFARHTLACEGAPTDVAGVARRIAATRARIGRTLLSDLRDPRPLGHAPRAYDVVVTAYCADSATDDLAIWQSYMHRIAALVPPGGLLVVAALRRAHGYRVGGRVFPSANLDAADLRHVLTPSFPDLRVETRTLPTQERHGYGGILLARGHRSAA